MKKSSFIILSILAFILSFGLIFAVGVFSSKNAAIDYEEKNKCFYFKYRCSKKGSGY